MKELGFRIKRAAENIGGLDALAPMLSGVSRRTLSDWVSDKTEPRASSIAEICEATGASLHWLMTGEGSAFRQDAAVNLEKSLRQMSSDYERKKDQVGDMITLPVYNEVMASAGPGAMPASETADGVISLARRFLKDLGAAPDYCSVIWTKGDSMQPTIPDGSILVVDRSQTDVVNGCIYVLNVADDLLVKRVRRRLDATVEIVSDNPIYPPEALRTDQLQQLRVIGRVVYFCRVP